MGIGKEGGHQTGQSDRMQKELKNILGSRKLYYFCTGYYLIGMGTLFREIF
jgi:hypothetical protein